MALSSKQTKIVLVSLAAMALASYLLLSSRKEKSKAGPGTPSGKSVDEDIMTPQASNKTRDEKPVHLKVEALDKKGKALFKEKKYLEAAHCFTEAMELIDAQGPDKSQSLCRQYITLVNNRSAMYEKGGVPDLALEDCATVLKEDVAHIKARTRRLRILESQERWEEALVEMCALELKFMQENREKLRIGIAVTPPVPHVKLEEILQKVIPKAVEKQLEVNNQITTKRPLPAKHTILQLLQSFTGYNLWMAAAAKEGTVAQLTEELETATEPTARAKLLFKRGRRCAYDRDFEAARDDFEAAFVLTEDGADQLLDDELADLLEWTGMVRHWSFNLGGANKCYERCSDLQPTNVRIENYKFTAQCTLSQSYCSIAHVYPGKRPREESRGQDGWRESRRGNDAL